MSKIFHDVRNSKKMLLHSRRERLGVFQSGRIKRKLPSATNTEQLKGKQNLPNSVSSPILNENEGSCQE